MAGRAILTNATFNATPLHYMKALLLPKWVLQRITQITRRFLWRGTNDTYSGGHCLISWPQVTKPKESGGLGIMDLRLQNKCLLVKWIWLHATDRNRLWSATLTALGITIDDANPPTRAKGSFIRDLIGILPIHKAASQQQQDGSITTVWSSSFSVKSIYSVCNNPGVTSMHFVELWSLCIPAKVKYFLWLLMHNRLNMADNLRKKGWPATDKCALCSSRMEESAQHIFLECTFTRVIVQRTLGPTIAAARSLALVWQLARSNDRLRPWASATWELWKERNARIFQNAGKPPLILQDRISHNVKQWSLAYDRPHCRLPQLTAT
jgi:zinc-binding in reverse transcriptase